MNASLPASRFRALRALLTGSPEALTFFIAARHARPAGGGASTSLAQPVPYHALHGETGEGFETRRSRYDLPAGVTVILALGFLTPILAIVIITHMG